MSPVYYLQDTDILGDVQIQKLVGAVGADGFLALAALKSWVAKRDMDSIHIGHLGTALAMVGLHDRDRDADLFSHLAVLGFLRHFEEWAFIHDVHLRYDEGEMSPEPDGFVYFVQSGDVIGPIKIGFSVDVPGRIATLQTGSSLPLRLLESVPSSQRTERRLHRRFAHLRQRGEWFQPAPELVNFIANLRSQP